MKRFLSIIPILLFFCSSCNLFDQLTQFNLEYNKTFTIPSVSGANLPENTEIPAIENNSTITCAVDNTHDGLIESAVLNKVKLTITSPSDGDFTFLNSIAIYMVADSLEEIKVAWQDSIPDDCGSSLSLNTTEENLKDYIVKDSFDIRVQTVVHKVITSDYTINLNSVFAVDAKILGQ